MLRASRVNPQLSANDSINDTFDFNKTPLAPVGCKIVAHEKPNKRKTFDPAGIQGWYVGPALEHHRCYTCYIPKSKGFRNYDTVDFFPHVKRLTPETIQQQINRKLGELLDLCKHTPSKLSKPNDRSLEIIQDNVSNLPKQKEQLAIGNHPIEQLLIKTKPPAKPI